MSEDPTRNQRTGRYLQRIPEYALNDSTSSAFVDEQGNLNERFARFLKNYRAGVSGKRGTFFFDGYLDLSRGQATIDGETYEIGVMDFNQNGIFDDVTSARKANASDRLLIDLSLDSLLSLRYTTEVFKLNDVFKVGGRKYKIANVDPLGAHLTLVATDDPITNYYLQEFEAGKEENGMTQKGTLADGFWDQTFADIDGAAIPLRSLKGRYVLLNFWGEWCTPCLAEIPDLIEIRETWPADQLVVLGMLKTEDLAAASELMNEKGLTWSQIRVDDTLADRLRINGYPTSILVLPDGETFVKTGQLTTIFIENYIQQR